MLSKVVNLVVFQLAWFACILGAGYGIPWLGIVVVSLSVVGHLAYASFDRSLAALFVAAFVIGWGFDWGVYLTGMLGFPEHARMLTGVPLWMPFMWVNLATTLTLSLGWMRRKYVLGAVFGLLGGPGAYFTGMKLDAVTLGEGVWVPLIVIGVEWAVAMPLLLLAVERFTRSGDGHTERTLVETSGGTA